MLKADNRGYEGSKPSTQYLLYMLEEDPDFSDGQGTEFSKVKKSLRDENGIPICGTH